MKLIDVYQDERATDVLYRLLGERQPHQNISHKRMPTLTEHQLFIAGRPYEAWYLIDVGDIAGAIYLSKQREIGVSIFKRCWGLGYGKTAVQLLRAAHPGRHLANINPANTASIRLFQDLGGRPLQVTYALEMST
jgi:RimJ/RimL family protein N-acetyltransferase